MAELAQKVIAATGSTSPVVHEPLPVDDPRQRQPNITKANTLLGWQPVTQLDEGLERTIEYFRSRLETSA